jgi:hypothetical protein
VLAVILNVAIWSALHILSAEVNQVRATGILLDVPCRAACARHRYS